MKCIACFWRLVFLCLPGWFILTLPADLFSQDVKPVPAGGEASPDTVFKEFLLEMSLEEIMGIEIDAGSYMASRRTDVPVSLTLIEREDIAITPARNLLDLLEVYVPGAIFVNHWKGPRIGIRGVMGDQNTSYLLLLNGENINLKTTMGPFFEIQNRDLNDISRIEIVRGAGSVTYGSGAIGGVIHIHTLSENEKSSPFEAGVEGNSVYRYGNFYARGAYAKKDLSLSWYASLNASAGEKNPMFFYVDRAHGYGYGFMGNQWGNKGLGTPAKAFYGDLWGKPQKKLQLDLRIKKSLGLWMRYSDNYFMNQQQEARAKDGPAFPGLTGKMFISALDFSPRLKENLQFTSRLGFSSKSNREISFYQGEAEVRDHITQRNYSYSENEGFLNLKLNYRPFSRFDFAAGGDFRYLYLGPEWGMGREDFINSFPPPLRFTVYDSLQSGFYQKYGSMGIVSQIDETIGAWQFSGFLEARVNIFHALDLIGSARVDKHEFSEYAFSPRVSLIGRLTERQRLKLTGQKAVRLPTFNELYTFNVFTNEDVSPEISQGIELMYNYQLNADWYIDFCAYYNSIEQIVWLAEGYPDIAGRFEVAGLESGMNYRGRKLQIAASYSYVRQLNWEPVKPLEAWLVNIGDDSLSYTLPDYGNNRLNNIPGHSIKFHANYRPGPRFTLHVNARYSAAWGQADMMESFKEIHNEYGAAHTRQEYEDIYSMMKDYGYTRPSFSSNLAVVFYPGSQRKQSLSLEMMNILSYNHIRYVFQYWEAGNNRQYPRQAGFLLEPFSLSLAWKYKL